MFTSHFVSVKIASPHHGQTRYNVSCEDHPEARDDNISYVRGAHYLAIWEV